MANKCTFCGSELQEGDVYCGKCGHLAPGMAPPANAWSKVEADLGGAPRKKRGCLRALLIFFLILALVVAALYFVLARGLGKSRDRDKDKDGKSGVSLSGLLEPAEKKEPAAAPKTASPAEATIEITPSPTAPVSEAAGPTETQANPFDDVSEDSYYYDAVLWCAAKGVVSAGTSFRPEDPCSRAQTITMLWRAVGSPEPTETGQLYTDVSSDHYCFKPAQWANEAGVTTASPGGAFRPDDDVTRAQMVTFLYRLVGYKADRMNTFTDVKEDDWFYDAALWALDAGIVGSADAFDPNGVCRRGNAATFLYRALADKY